MSPSTLSIQFPRFLMGACAAVLVLLLAACGGGGGGGGGGDAGNGGGGGGPVLPAWQTAELLESVDAQADAVDVAVNASGVAYAVWLQEDAGGTRVWSSRYLDGAWELRRPVSQAQTAADPQVVVHADGRATAIWRQPVGVLSAVVGSTTNPSGNWAPAATLQGSQILDPADLQLTSNGAGEAMASWRFGGGVFASHYTAGQFGQARQISVSLNGDAESAHVAMDPTGNGNALAVWTELNAANERKVHSRMLTGGQWNQAALILSGQDPADMVRAALGANGRAVVTWIQTSGPRQLVAARLAGNAFANQWQLGQTVLSDRNLAVAPQAAMQAGGQAVVAWAESDGGPGADVMASRFDGSTWVRASVDGSALPAGGVRLGMDDSGAAFAVWLQADAVNSSIASNRLDPITGSWGTPELIETENRGSASDATLAVSGAGRAVAAWKQQNGTTNPPGGGGAAINSIAANVLK